MFCPRCHRLYQRDPSQRFCPFDGAELSAAPRIDSLRKRPTEIDGEILDNRYRICGFLGQGGMASVYLAEDLGTREPVAVKILDRESSKQPSIRARFLREIMVASAIGHPNVVQILAAGERPDHSPYLVMEFLFGETLGELLRRDEFLEPSFALPLIRMAASALAAAHRVGVVHRDVKPDNLFLLGERGDPYSSKIVDLGLAKLVEVQQTGAGVAIGTLSFMSPEQILAEPIDGRADIYGLGIVLFRMLTGRLPFEQKERPLLTIHHLFMRPPRPSSLRFGLDPAIDAIILTAIRKNPENRYPSMEALIEDIDRVLGERPGALWASGSMYLPDEFVPVNAHGQAVSARFRDKMKRLQEKGELGTGGG